MNQSETIIEKTQTPNRRKSHRSLPWWMQLTIMLVIFTAGGVVGAMIATNVLHSRMQYYREHPDALPKDIVPRLQTRLRLSEEQTSQIREIIERRHPRMIKNRKQSDQAMLDEFDVMEHEIANVLDEDQKQLWQGIVNSVRRRFLPPARDE